MDFEPLGAIAEDGPARVTARPPRRQRGSSSKHRTHTHTLTHLGDKDMKQHTAQREEGEEAELHNAVKLQSKPRRHGELTC